MVLAIDFMMDKISKIICFYVIKLVDYERLSHKHLSGTQKGVPVKLYPISHLFYTGVNVQVMYWVLTRHPVDKFDVVFSTVYCLLPRQKRASISL